VRSGKALYAGISSYNPAQTTAAVKILRDLGTPCLIHQPRYSMFERTVENGLLDVLGDEGVGAIAFCPLAQGLLTGRYLQGIPAGSRASKPHGFLKKDSITEDRLTQVRDLSVLAVERGQSLAQMALAWVLRDVRMTSALIGASRVEQIEENVAALANLEFSAGELTHIDAILSRPA
jgi:L-glyceraldehyde 3-phosphate reductase